MTRNEYIIENFGTPIDRKFVKQLLMDNPNQFDYPCKLVVKSNTGCNQFYVEQSNIRGHGFIIIDWRR